MSTIPELPGIYQIRNLVNNKVYIGSSNNLRNRKASHFKCLKSGRHENPHLQRAYNKYGKDNFIFEILELCTLEEQYIVEQKWINEKFGDNCYNINPIASKPPSSKGKPDIHKKISKALKEYYKDPNNRLKSSLSKIRHKVSEETRHKLSIVNKGKQPSDKCIQAFKEYVKTRVISDETRHKISVAGLGRKHTEASKDKMKTKVICIETQQVFNSVQEAGEFAKVHYTGISKCCKKHKRTAGGYHWEYYTP